MVVFILFYINRIGGSSERIAITQPFNLPTRLPGFVVEIYQWHRH